VRSLASWKGERNRILTPRSSPALCRFFLASVAGIGWRYLLGTLAVSVPVRSLAQAQRGGLPPQSTPGGRDADGHLRVDLRPDRVELSVQTRAVGAVTGCDAQLAHRIEAAVGPRLGLPPAGATSARVTAGRSSCWRWPSTRLTYQRSGRSGKAVMGYVDEPGSDGPQDGIVDPAGQLPAIWFQQMDTPAGAAQPGPLRHHGAPRRGRAPGERRAGPPAAGLSTISFAPLVLGPGGRRRQRGMRLHLDRPRRAGAIGGRRPSWRASDRLSRRFGPAVRHGATDSFGNTDLGYRRIFKGGVSVTRGAGSVPAGVNIQACLCVMFACAV